jgi:hypothetical protein
LRRRLSVFWLLGLLAPFPALAQGAVTGVSPNPSPGVTCQLETIKISATGNCASVRFDLGDSAAPANLPGPFPRLVYHTYKSAGTFSLKAQGEGNCAGVATARLPVLGPTITSILAFSVIKPGGGVLLQGLRFGALPGQLLIKLQSQLLPQNLENIQWGDTFAAGTIPQGISGAPDQPASLYLVASCGAVSNELSVNFTATRDLVALPFGQISCGSTAGLGDSDACQNSGSYGVPAECGYVATFGTQPGPTGFQAYHASGWGFSGESGNDQFWGPSLKNGWGFDSASPIAGEYKGAFQQPTYWYESPVGGVETKATVNWKTDNCGLIFYGANLYVSGPFGVPYQ